MKRSVIAGLFTSFSDLSARAQSKKTIRQSVFMALVCAPSLAHAGSIYICADHVDPDDWAGEWATGPIHIPAGTVFDYAGHMHGTNLQDPTDQAQYDSTTSRWIGVPKPIQDQWNSWLAEDIGAPSAQITKQAIITTDEATLTENHPCITVPGASLLSPAWNWTTYPVFGNASLYYEISGVVVGGQFDTAFDSGTSLDNVGQLTELHAQVRGTLTDKVTLEDAAQ